ncbi:MAG: molybdopterin synthase catalytic subunit MoaE [Gammaproteobacteria bacterium]|jgi:molybdopterin synthase catalytic subunit|nr:molybdopterin synthase catalytic subunit MoaE [Gammaproteobacteria bacterium]MBT3723740.1 molybdopterin synthase catalytic subunit MoaE [Gammaproteobacteria bacterium]MBT4077206.1 molybdopterin synthase catalytic subunit MoaE [Gammaproteobacteria bacterium]MBT4192927.1 molybdopterin synthase catalytic subunit MoaE [Gammaproteobacteria bacterium]MBT4450525.1 molybdopterin synthase catalytic subunit MoaE [Gammaproteobacteria bacterium]
MLISVQQEDFDVSAVTSELCSNRKDIGAVVTFSGMVRDQSPDQNLLALELEHYPGMTEKALEEISNSAMKRWDIDDLAIIHRVGQLKPAENIVMVVVISAHRKEAFDACEFLMDYLKTQAPFWKKEITKQGEQWIEFKESDQQAADNWK